jgi:L-cysteine:1D-myo-inositol 2-amino-2-deoxy-alpha-D-glucopyranoside ligase
MLRKLRDEGLLGTVGPNAKRAQLDFPLWRASAPDEPAWQSKFGPGRPGWHIECSAMAMRYLGDQIDIHGGGRDLEFSHHESERAQSESMTGKAPFARAWMHTGMVRYEGRKMSKSLGNLVKVSQGLQRAPAAAIRLYLVSHHYHSDWDFSWQGLARASRLIERLRSLLAEIAPTRRRSRPATPSRALVAEFERALADDLDTPRAVRALQAALRQRDGAAAAWMLSILVGTASLT